MPPTPTPSGNNYAGAIADAAGGLSGGSTNNPTYGLSGAAQGYQFSVDGIPGLSGQMTGAQLLSVFLSAGQSDDPQKRAMVAAIQHALAYGGYYGTSTPVSGEVKGEDATAFGKALNDLFTANQSQTTATPGGKLVGMGVSQFLTSQATVGAANGPGAPSAAVAQVYNVRAPNADDVANTYIKVAEQVTGKKPDASEIAAFVSNYTQDYVANEKQNYQSQYDAQVQKAQVKAGAAGQGSMLSTPTGPAPTPVGPGTVLQPGHGPAKAMEGMGAGDVPTPTLADNMQTLQDVINANSQGPADQSQPGFITAGTDAPESPSVAAENYARNEHPDQAAASDLNSTFGTFLKLLAGNFGG